jgi:rhamnosyltransferase
MIAAVIVLHHPDLILLERLLASLASQADRVVAIDNTPGSPAALAPFLKRFQCAIAYIPLGNNKGIAEAQNIGIRDCIGAGCSHVLLLDQDSALLPGMVDKLIAAEGELLKAGIKVGAVGPRYVDGKTDIPSFAIRYGAVTVQKIALDPLSSIPVETDILIASGSIIRTATLQTVGKMRSDLFIDLVDTEWALRARSKGYKNYCIPNARMMHSVGDAAIKVFGKSVYLHSDVRKYYRLRNAMYLLQESSMGWKWRSYILRWIPYYLLLNLWTSEHKLSSARLLLNALWDGMLGSLGPARQYHRASGVSLDSSLSFREGR